MKRIIRCLLVIILITNNCNSQNLSVELQQIVFKDKMLEKIFTNMTVSDCFEKTNFYMVDFFISSTSNKKYYLSIDQLITNDACDSITYYFVVNNTVFFIPKKIPSNLFQILSVKKKFSYKIEESHPGGDYNFLIYGTLNGYYKVIYNSCDE